MEHPVAEFVFGSEYTDQGRAGGLLRLTGELDLASVQSFERALLEADGQRTLVLDLRRLHLIDCASLRVIFREADRYRRDGRRLVLLPGTSSVEKVLRTVGAENWVEIACGEGVDRPSEGSLKSPAFPVAA